MSEPGVEEDFDPAHIWAMYESGELFRRHPIVLHVRHALAWIGLRHDREMQTAAWLAR